jgi:glycosyltransferase involved in cell wall biosynthesis
MRLIKIKRQALYSIDPSRVAGTTASPPVDISPVTVENVTDVLPLRGRAVVDLFRSQLHDGQVGKYARENGVVVGHAWLIPPAARGRRVNSYLELPPGVAHIHFCYVSERLRGRGIYPALLRALVVEAKSLGARRVTVDTAVGNVASRRGIEKAGFEHIGSQTYVIVAGLTVWGRSTPEHRHQRTVLTISLEVPSPGSAPEVHLNAIADAFGMAGWVVDRAWGTSKGRGRLIEILLQQIRLVARLRKCDVGYMRWHPLGLPTVALARALRKPLILECNGTVDDVVMAHSRARALVKVLRLSAIAQYRLASAAIGVAPGIAQELRKYVNHVVMLPNGAHASLTAYGVEPAEPPYAIFVGELAPWQGIDTLLEARADPAWPRGIRLVIVGDGALRDAVSARESSIEYVGRVPRHEAHALLAKAICSVSPQTGRIARNRLGVTPIKVAESLMLGVPVVATDLPGQAELVSAAPHSRVVPPDDSRAIALAVAAIAREEQDRQAIRAWAQQHVSWERIGALTVAMCEAVMEQL